MGVAGQDVFRGLAAPAGIQAISMAQDVLHQHVVATQQRDVESAGIPVLPGIRVHATFQQQGNTLAKSAGSRDGQSTWRPQSGKMAFNTRGIAAERQCTVP